MRLKAFITLTIILMLLGCSGKPDILLNEKNERAIDYFCKNSNYVFRGTMKKEYSKWCPIEKHACTMYEFKADNDTIKIKYLAIHPDENFIMIQGLPKSGVIIKTDPGTPTLEEERDYIIFVKIVQLEGGESNRYVGALIIDKDENVVLYNGEEKTVPEFMRILKKKNPALFKK